MNNAMQLKAIIKNLAKEKHISAQLVMQNFMLERLTLISGYFSADNENLDPKVSEGKILRKTVEDANNKLQRQNSERSRDIGR
jgi:hypothetical protein